MDHVGQNVRKMDEDDIFHFLENELNIFEKTYEEQGGEGRQTKAENLRSSRAIQSIFSLLGRNGKFFIFVI